MAKADSRWIDEFRARYADWWPEAQPMIERHDYATAFKTYAWPAFTTAPWTPVTKPLAASRVGVVTTGGLYRAGVDAPFDGGAPEGDWTFRSIAADVPIQTLAMHRLIAGSVTTTKCHGCMLAPLGAVPRQAEPAR